MQCRLSGSPCMNYNWNSYEISPGHIVIVVTGAETVVK